MTISFKEEDTFEKNICVVLIFMMFLSLAACGGNSQTDQEQPGDSGQAKSQQTVPDKASEPEKPGDGKGIVCVSYKAYDDAWGDFNKHITGQSGDHEIVSVHQSTAMPLELKNLDYLLPLSFLGQSQRAWANLTQLWKPAC